MVVPRSGSLLMGFPSMGSVVEGLLDFDFLVCFDDVAHLDVIETVDVQTALEAFLDFFGVVLEALE